MMAKDDIQLQILRLLQQNPEWSQRELAMALGVSLGSTHYCLRALIQKGWVKAQNFSHSSQKNRYLYQLTPTGVAEKARITREFIQRKKREYEAIRQEIAELQAELKGQGELSGLEG